MSRKQYRDWDLNQVFLLPPSIRDWVDDDHMVFRLLEVVDELDLSEITSMVQAKDPRGVRPYNPAMMSALILYGYLQGIYSARKLGAAVKNRVDFRVISANEVPHYTVIHRFRKGHREALGRLLPQVVAICIRAGLVSLNHLSIDGTKISTATSKHKAMSYKRMKDETSRLEKLFEEFLDESDAADEQEDRLYGEGRDVDDLDPELKRADERLRRIRKAKKELEEEAKAARAHDLRERANTIERNAEDVTDAVELRRKASRVKRYRKEAAELAEEEPRPEPEEMPKHRIPTTTKGLPKDAAQRNFTDSESRIMKRNGDYLQGFNGQIVVDEAHQIIIAAGLSNLAPDQPHFKPMMERVKAQVGRTDFKVSADAGYISDDNLEYCETHGIDAYISTHRRKRREQEPPPKPDDSRRGKMATKLRTEDGAKIYSRRKAIVEPVFGQMMWNRCFRRFSFLGLDANSAEFALLATAHNLMKLIASRKLGLRSSSAATATASGRSKARKHARSTSDRSLRTVRSWSWLTKGSGLNLCATAS